MNLLATSTEQREVKSYYSELEIWSLKRIFPNIERELFNKIFMLEGCLLSISQILAFKRFFWDNISPNQYLEIITDNDQLLKLVKDDSDIAWLFGLLSLINIDLWVKQNLAKNLLNEEDDLPQELLDNVISITNDKEKAIRFIELLRTWNVWLDHLESNWIVTKKMSDFELHYWAFIHFLELYDQLIPSELAWSIRNMFKKSHKVLEIEASNIDKRLNALIWIMDKIRNAIKSWNHWNLNSINRQYINELFFIPSFICHFYWAIDLWNKTVINQSMIFPQKVMSIWSSHEFIKTIVMILDNIDQLLDNYNETDFPKEDIKKITKSLKLPLIVTLNKNATLLWISRNIMDLSIKSRLIWKDLWLWIDEIPSNITVDLVECSNLDYYVHDTNKLKTWIIKMVQTLSKWGHLQFYVRNWFSRQFIWLLQKYWFKIVNEFHEIWLNSATRNQFNLIFWENNVINFETQMKKTCHYFFATKQEDIDITSFSDELSRIPVFRLQDWGDSSLSLDDQELVIQNVAWKLLLKTNNKEDFISLYDYLDDVWFMTFKKKIFLFQNFPNLWMWDVANSLVFIERCIPDDDSRNFLSILILYPYILVKNKAIISFIKRNLDYYINQLLRHKLLLDELKLALIDWVDISDIDIWIVERFLNQLDQDKLQSFTKELINYLLTKFDSKLPLPSWMKTHIDYKDIYQKYSDIDDRSEDNKQESILSDYDIKELYSNSQWKLEFKIAHIGVALTLYNNTKDDELFNNIFSFISEYLFSLNYDRLSKTVADNIETILRSIDWYSIKLPAQLRFYKRFRDLYFQIAMWEWISPFGFTEQEIEDVYTCKWFINIKLSLISWAINYALENNNILDNLIKLLEQSDLVEKHKDDIKNFLIKILNMFEKQEDIDRIIDLIWKYDSGFPLVVEKKLVSDTFLKITQKIDQLANNSGSQISLKNITNEIEKFFIDNVSILESNLIYKVWLKFIESYLMFNNLNKRQTHIINALNTQFNQIENIKKIIWWIINSWRFEGLIKLRFREWKNWFFETNQMTQLWYLNKEHIELHLRTNIDKIIEKIDGNIERYFELLFIFVDLEFYNLITDLLDKNITFLIGSIEHKLISLDGFYYISIKRPYSFECNDSMGDKRMLNNIMRINLLGCSGLISDDIVHLKRSEYNWYWFNIKPYWEITINWKKAWQLNFLVIKGKSVWFVSWIEFRYGWSVYFCPFKFFPEELKNFINRWKEVSKEVLLNFELFDMGKWDNWTNIVKLI